MNPHQIISFLKKKETIKLVAKIVILIQNSNSIFLQQFLSQKFLSRKKKDATDRLIIFEVDDLSNQMKRKFRKSN